MAKVCLDGGHGGSDPGGEGNGIQEKTINLDVILELGKYFKFLGIDVVYTRTTDVFVSLADRAKIANNAGCDYFISKHSNMAGTPNVATGAETYAYAPGGNGEKLANKVQANLVAFTSFKNRGVKFANFQVLRETSMPAILIEDGFMDNSNDAAILKTFDHVKKVCQAVTKGYCEHLGITWKDMYAPTPTAPAPVDYTKLIADLKTQLSAEQDKNAMYIEWVELTKKVLGL